MLYIEEISPLVEESRVSSRCFSKGDSSGKFGKSTELSWSQCLICRNLKWLFCGSLNLEDSCWKLDSVLLQYKSLTVSIPFLDNFCRVPSATG